MKAAYCRVSSISQRLDRQLLGLTNGADSEEFIIYEDKCSGAIPLNERPSGKKMLRDIEEGLIDTVVCWELSRLGRDLISVLEQTREFAENGIQLIVQKEGIKLLLDDGKLNPISNLLISMMSSIAMMSRLSIKEKQAEGIAARKLRGLSCGGRTKGSYENTATQLAKPRSRRIAKLLSQELNVTQIAQIVGCSRNLVRKVRSNLAA